MQINLDLLMPANAPVNLSRASSVVLHRDEVADFLSELDATSVRWGGSGAKPSKGRIILEQKIYEYFYIEFCKTAEGWRMYYEAVQPIDVDWKIREMGAFRLYELQASVEYIPLDLETLYGTEVSV